jgi:cytochrome c5
MRLKYELFAVVLMSALPVVSIAGTQNVPAAKKAAPTAHAAPQSGTEGQRIFQQQCSRCHNAPEGFSPRISGTVIRHMRVRASLSRHDEEELLHFLNP